MFEKNTWEIGIIINRKDGVSTFGWNLKDKESICETVMRVIGRKELEMVLVCFTMQMVQNMKVSGIKI